MTEGRDAAARFAAYVEAAEAHEGRREWEQAAGAWVEAGRVAVEAGALPSAREVLAAAGEAFRRDDRVTEARRALTMAADVALSPRGSPPAGPTDAALKVQLAAVCAELGDPDAAFAHLEGLPGDALTSDTRAGLALGHRRKATARALVEQLAAKAPPLATWFRQGQLARLDGDLEQARRLQEATIEALRDHPAGWAGVAASRSELAELDLLEGRPLAAMASSEDARRQHEQAGRRSLALRAEAARTRAAVEAGLAVFPAALRAGLAFADNRGLPMLRVDLQLAVGAAMSRSDPDGARAVLEDAVRAADRATAPLHAGRGRAMLAQLADDRARPALVAQARRDLADHAPLLAKLAAQHPDLVPGLRRVVRAALHRDVPWRNGLGTTRELAVEPPGSTLGDGAVWRLSAAPVVADGAFSSFPDVDRVLVLLEGRRLDLTVDGVRVTLDHPGALHTFPGDVPTHGAVPEGPIRDLNLMVARGVPHRAQIVSAPSSPPGPGVFVVVPLWEPTDVEGVPVGPLEVVVTTRCGVPPRWFPEVPALFVWLDLPGASGST